MPRPPSGVSHLNFDSVLGRSWYHSCDNSGCKFVLPRQKGLIRQAHFITIIQDGLRCEEILAAWCGGREVGRESRDFFTPYQKLRVLGIAKIHPERCWGQLAKASYLNKMIPPSFPDKSTIILVFSAALVREMKVSSRNSDLLGKFGSKAWW